VEIKHAWCNSTKKKVNEIISTRAIFVSLIVEGNDDGYLAQCRGIQGVLAERNSIEEAIFNCVDVIKLIAAYRTECGESMGFNVVELTPKTRMTVAMPVGVGR
jgi:predicted RNase H-like HicB family nuclease